MIAAVIAVAQCGLKVYNLIQWKKMGGKGLPPEPEPIPSSPVKQRAPEEPRKEDEPKHQEEDNSSAMALQAMQDIVQQIVISDSSNDFGGGASSDF